MPSRALLHEEYKMSTARVAHSAFVAVEALQEPANSVVYVVTPGSWNAAAAEVRRRCEWVAIHPRQRVEVHRCCTKSTSCVSRTSKGVRIVTGKKQVQGWVRRGIPVGVKVDLMGPTMYDFLVINAERLCRQSSPNADGSSVSESASTSRSIEARRFNSVSPSTSKVASGSGFAVSLKKCVILRKTVLIGSVVYNQRFWWGLSTKAVQVFKNVGEKIVNFSARETSGLPTLCFVACATSVRLTTFIYIYLHSSEAIRCKICKLPLNYIPIFDATLDCLMPPPLPNQPTAHPLTHLTNTTQNLTELVHAQMEDIKVQTELMRKWEERDKAPASMLVRQGFATVFAVSRPDAAAAACKVCDWYKPDSQQIM
ncbi:hypothetical protein BC835DRAFT_1309861 [Cytidiella melzeri]|nr:hypothetical protein BC835DRAFT_1309861 [Cytidiella melzeri]